jgi:hypothetical protein
VVLRGIFWLAQAVYVYNDTEMRKIGSWYTQVWCLILVMWVYVIPQAKEFVTTKLDSTQMGYLADMFVNRRALAVLWVILKCQLSRHNSKGVSISVRFALYENAPGLGCSLT